MIRYKALMTFHSNFIKIKKFEKSRKENFDINMNKAQEESEKRQQIREMRLNDLKS